MLYAHNSQLHLEHGVVKILCEQKLHPAATFLLASFSPSERGAELETTRRRNISPYSPTGRLIKVVLKKILNA